MNEDASPEERREALSARPDRREYEVGHGKPPKDTRFKPGQSGNPGGRPKGSKNRRKSDPLDASNERLKDIVLEEAYRTVKINDGPRQIDVPMAQAVIRSVSHNAVKGNARAQRLFTELVAVTEQARKREREALFEAAVEYKLDWQKEIERCERLGLEPPDPVPHPDHIKIDPRAGSVHFLGPMTDEEKRDWDWLQERRQEWQGELKRLRIDLAAETDPDTRRFIEDEIRRVEDILDALRQALPEEHP